MKILMLGWEYPPNISGGLGVASQGLANALTKKHEVSFVIPKLKGKNRQTPVTIVDASRIDFNSISDIELNTQFEVLEIGAELIPYLPPNIFKKTTKNLKKADISDVLDKIELTGNYGSSLGTEISKYSLLAIEHAAKNQFDIVHAHDWMTFKAAARIKAICNIPMVAHVHSTEVERNGSYADEHIMEQEKQGLELADVVITVSSVTKNKLIDTYKLPSKKIKVVPNGVNATKQTQTSVQRKTIGFVGRFTHQKAPGTFVDIARELNNRRSDLHFEMIGDGYLMENIKYKIKQLHLDSKIELTGFLSIEETQSRMSQFDVLVVPSVSEPFGLVALEAVQSKIPVLVAENAGILDFISDLTAIPQWDIYTYSKTIEKIIDEPQWSEQIANKVYKQAKSLTWPSAANMVNKIYESLGTTDS
jgi:glycosyltransferase involved in cell wall biosynthesis